MQIIETQMFSSKIQDKGYGSEWHALHVTLLLYFVALLGFGRRSRRCRTYVERTSSNPASYR